MESCTTYLAGKRFETVLGKHRIITDQPSSQGGEDAGPTPPELLLASLGACSGHYAAEYLAARSLPLRGLKIHVSAEKATTPARLGSFRIEVAMPDSMAQADDRHRQGLLRAVKACIIHNTLTNTPDIDLEVIAAPGLCRAA